MKGNNSIILNHDTMLEAMQLWLDDNFKNPPVAKNILRATDGTSMFKLVTSEPEPILTPPSHDPTNKKS